MIQRIQHSTITRSLLLSFRTCGLDQMGDPDTVGLRNETSHRPHKIER